MKNFIKSTKQKLVHWFNKNEMDIRDFIIKFIALQLLITAIWAIWNFTFGDIYHMTWLQSGGALVLWALLQDKKD